MTKKAPRGTLPDWDRWPAGHLPVPAIDPGEGTGIALLVVPEDSIYGSAEPDITVIWNEEIAGPEKSQARKICCLAVDVGLRWGSYGQGGHDRPFPVVFEDFSLRIFTRDPALLSPVRITAMVDVKLDDAALKTQIFRQQVADPQKIYSDEMLKDLGLYAEGQKNARIAMKQALYFLRRARRSQALREMAWGRR